MSTRPSGRCVGVQPGKDSTPITEAEARKAEALTAEEVIRVLAVAGKFYPDHADVLRVWAETGLRLGEACGLQWTEVAGRFLNVQRTVAYRKHQLLIGAPKSGQARQVDLSVSLATRLAERRSVKVAEAALAGRGLSPWVFPAPSDDTKPLNAEHLRFKVWYRVLPLAKLKGVKLHTLRHSYASLQLQAGEPITYVQGQLGHSSIKLTVDIYGHFVPGANRAAADRLAAELDPAKYDISATSPEPASPHRHPLET